MTIVGVGQAELRVGELEHNRAAVESLLADAARQGVEILLLPELANSGYVFSDPDEARACAERVPDGLVCQMLCEWSRGGRLACCGICEDGGEALYNAAVVFAEGRQLATYRKAHLFRDEKLFFAPGNEPPPVVRFQEHTIGVMICFDWIFPEMARLLALQGAQLILHPSNLVLPYAQAAMLTRSIENRVFTATANRTGLERGVRFTGQSQMTGPRGELFTRASEDFQGVLAAEMNLQEADDKQVTPRNQLWEDRRVDLYGGLVE